MQLKDFFTKYLFISIILILSGILVSMIPSPNGTLSFIIEVTSKIIESLGIAILIGNIFTFTMGTEQFLNYIRDRLIKVVISKEFITKSNLFSGIGKSEQLLSHLHLTLIHLIL